MSDMVITPEMIIKKFTELEDVSIRKGPDQTIYGDIYSVRGGFYKNVAYHLVRNLRDNSVELYVSDLEAPMFNKWMFLQRFPDDMITPIMVAYNKKKEKKEFEELNRAAQSAYEFFSGGEFNGEHWIEGINRIV